MSEQEIQALAEVYADIVFKEHIGVIMAVRSYGACIVAGEHPSWGTTERFYEAVKGALADEYKTVIHYMHLREQIALERAIAVQVFNVINDMLKGCER